MKSINYTHILCFAFILLLNLPLVSSAQLIPSGSETVTNTTTSNNQQRPAVSIDDSGNYTVVWESQGQDGDGYGIYRAVFQSYGTAAQCEVVVNSTTANDQRFPDVAMNASGEAVTVWQSYNEDGDSWGVYKRKHDGSFGNNGGQAQVNTTTTGRQCMPKVGVDDDLNYIIVWEGKGDIFGRLYGDGGGTSVSEFQINTTSSNVQNYPDVAMNGNGDFVAVWQSYGQDGDGFGIYFQRYNSSGVAQGSETLVNTTTSGNQTSPSVSMDADGNYVVVWTDNAADGDGKGIFAQRFDADGTANGAEFQVNTTTVGAQDNAEVAMTQEGAFSMVWDSYGQDGEYTGAYNQSYYADGTASGSEIAVNTTTDFFQQFPSIALRSADDAVIVWQDGLVDSTTTLDAGGYGVVFRQYSAAALPIELLYFYGEKAERGVQLYWETANEINNSHFEVEWSTDGRAFQKIGRVAGAGTTSQAQQYGLLHETPAIGNNYYRLQQVDFDGKYEYSRIVNIRYQSTDIGYSIYPNPTADFVVIENAGEEGLVEIFDGHGHFVESFQLQANSSKHSLAGLPKGTYFLKIKDSLKRVIVQ
ncbi:MAG: T9SS type A sorting domain-containing protein [Lewinellaceae bacterium]|nr:T9SS type A sorting domain-containing protein [Lewinellaceae bacterium]